MSTKFIGTNGFGEIESLEISKDRKKQLRARELKRKLRLENILLSVLYYILVKPVKAVRNFSFQEYKRSLTFKKAMTNLVAPVAGVVALLFTIGICTQNANIESAEEKQILTSVSNTSALEKANNSTEVEANLTPVYQFSSMSVKNNNSITSAFDGTDTSVSENVAGLYINDKLIGVCDSDKELQSALDELLQDDIDYYDEETEVRFNNNVEVKTGIYSNRSITSADSLVKKAKDKGLLKVLVKTDIIMTEKQPFETKVKYDDTKDTTYKKVVKKGVYGKQKTTYRVSYIDGVQVDAVITDIKTVKKAKNQIVIKGKGAEGVDENSVSSSGFLWPVPNVHTISSPYGYREGGEFHTGLDIADGDCYGASIVASRAGTVEWAGYDDSGYGNYVIIDHGDGYKTLYGHCSSVCVSQGQQVSQGQTIAYVGSTGQSTGDHLHFEVRTGDDRSDRQNPQDYL